MTNNFLLVSGIGPQGRKLSDVCKHGLNSEIEVLANLLRAIIYASSSNNFASVS